MGKNISVDGRVVWDPALRVAQLFQAQLAAVEEVLGVASGVDEPIDDEIEIDWPVFEAFVRHLLETLATTGHPVMHLLLEGLAETCVGVHHAATDSRIDAPTAVDDLVDRAIKLPFRPS
ncbi:DUF6086 family protein [Actinoplanes utahensis]|uniref:DUF6086 family protein n=1 Tax=Actinoplanes utahensis TaxID=1869 RepID=UPI00126A0616|nr:DUF6086 family protein [Actinoplanes utahensis]GIF31828.1 hypothetical protein Aut01nite_48140 [Actinoplanes utahensis]